MNWEQHLPVTYDFGENIIFSTGSYNTNPMIVHQNLNKHITLTEEYFERWLKLFSETLNELFEGEKAIQTKQKATRIATVMRFKIPQENSTLLK